MTLTATANAILTLDEARAELKERAQAYDAIIQRRVNALSTIFETRTGLTFAKQTLTGFRVDGSDKEYILIPIIPVQSVSKVVIRDAYDDTIESTITDTTKYVLKGKDIYGHSFTGRLQLIDEAFLLGKSNVALDMIVGLETTHPMWADVQRLLVTQLAYEYRRWQHDEAGVIAKSLPDGNISFAPPTNLLREVAEALDAMHMRTFA